MAAAAAVSSVPGLEAVLRSGIRKMLFCRYKEVWAEGIYFNVRLSTQRPCVVIFIGATALIQEG